MASTIGKVAAVFTASTSGLRSGIDDALRSFRQLGGEAGVLKASFSSLQSVAASGVGSVGPAADKAASSLRMFQGLAAKAQESLAAGRITADDFARKMQMIAASADKAAAATGRGAAITSQFESAEERSARQVAELNGLLSQGMISQETHARAMVDATGAAAAERRELEAAAKQMDAMSAVFAEGAAVTRSVETAEERHAAELQRLKGLLSAGAISQQTYARAVDKADDELRQAKISTSTLGSATRAASAGVERLAGKLNTLIAINAAQLFSSIASRVSMAVSSFYGMAEAQSAVIDRGSDLAARLGMTYGELAGISLAGTQVGVSMDAIAKSATRADVAFVKASSGSAAASAAFASVGLSVDQLNGKSPAERFNAIAVAIAKLPTAAERSRAAIAIFGKAGGELLPMFEGGAAAIEQATADAQAFGLALTNDQASSVNSMRDAFDRAHAAVQGVIGQIVAHLSPAMQAAADTFSNLVGNVGGATIGQMIGEKLIEGAQVLAVIADGMIAGTTGVWEYVSQVGSYWSSVFAIGGQIASLFAAGGRFLSAAFQTIVLGFSSLVERVLIAAKGIADMIPGLSSGTLDGMVAGAGAFNDELRRGITENMAAAAENWNAATNPSTTAGTAPTAGPLSSMLANALEEARRNAAATSQAEKQSPKSTGPTTAVGLSREQIRATDSTSKEGIAEMFRLLRGGGDDVAQQQLSVLEQIRDSVSEPDDAELLEFAG